MRSVVASQAPRCARCRLALRWCVCPVHAEVQVPLALTVLAHHREPFRPSSTGTLIRRVLPGSQQAVWRRERGLTAGEVQTPGRELWILHPHGEPLPEPLPDPRTLQIMLLDGSWSETSAMAQEISGWGRLVSLPMAGVSRYWLRAQASAGRFSTVEALLFLLERFGLHEAAGVLRLQFELHVYASLRARGQKERAEAFLAGSPARAAFAEFIAALNVPRPRVDGA